MPALISDYCRVLQCDSSVRATPLSYACSYASVILQYHVVLNVKCAFSLVLLRAVLLEPLLRDVTVERH